MTDVKQSAAIYYRIESTSQTSAAADLQESSQEVWGRAPFGSLTAKVEAFRGPLPTGAKGIEFHTDVAPDDEFGPIASWSGPREGVRVENDFAKISVRISRRTQ